MGLDTELDQPRIMNHLRAALWIALLGISLAAFADSLGDLYQYPGVDLRARVVGVRAMLLGLDPYFIPASSHQVETLQDPARYAAAFSRCTYAPTLLYLYAPFAHRSYQAQRCIWFALEWSALIGSILLLRGILRGKVLKEVFTALAIFFFADGTFWRLHLERGQYYIFLVFFFSLTAWLCLRPRQQDDDRTLHDRLWYGIPLGLAAAIRLTPFAILLPLWAARYRRTALGAALTGIICIAATVRVSGSQLWFSYFSNASLQSKLMHDSDYHAKERAALPPLPQTVEGVDFSHVLDLPERDITFWTSFLLPLSDMSKLIPPAKHWDTISAIAAFVLCILSAIFLARARSFDHFERFAAVMFFATLIDFCVPRRISYADISFLVPVAMLMVCMLRSRRGYIWFSVVLLGLALGHSLLSMWDDNSPIFRPIFLVSGIMMFLVVRFFEPRPELQPAASKTTERLFSSPAEVFHEKVTVTRHRGLNRGDGPAITN